MQAHPLRSAAVALAVLAVAACASSERPSPETASIKPLPGNPGCFFLADVSGPGGASWTVLDDSTLLMKVPGVRAGNTYLIKLFFPVFDLRMHLNLGFQDVDHNGRICNNSRDYIVVPGYTPSRIMITAVRQVTPTEVASLERAAGRSVASKTP